MLSQLSFSWLLPVGFTRLFHNVFGSSQSFDSSLRHGSKGCLVLATSLLATSLPKRLRFATTTVGTGNSDRDPVECST